MTTKIDELAEALGGRRSSIRGSTHSRILRAIAQQIGDGVRREIATELDISAATVSKSLAQLSELGLVEEQSQRASGPGRPVVLMSLTRNFAVIGIAVVSNDGQPHELIGTVTSLDGKEFPGFRVGYREEVKPEARTDPRLLTEQLVIFATDLAQTDTGGAIILGCGITGSGHVDGERGLIKRAFGCDWTEEERPDRLSFKQRIENQLGIPVVVDNDVTSLAVRNNLRPTKEYPVENYAVVAPIDYGVGGAVVVNTKTWRGAHGMAGEPGHIPATGVTQITRLPDAPDVTPLELTMPICNCRQEGHVEAFASPCAIERRALDNGVVKRRCEIGELAAHSRNEHATSLLFYQGGVALGAAIVSLINWLDPDRVLLYLPVELSEKNKYLAGSYYLRGLEDEIQRSAFQPNSFSIISINPTSSAEMQERLASAAGYLVFRKLIMSIQNTKPSR